MALFFRIVPGSPRERADGAIYGMEIAEDVLRQKVVDPFQAGAHITWEGRTISSRGAQITISRIDDQFDGYSLADLRTRANRGAGYRRRVGDAIGSRAPNVTSEYIRTGTPHTTDTTRQAQQLIGSRGSEFRPQRAIAVFFFFAAVVALFIGTPPIWIGGCVVGVSLAAGLKHERVWRLPPTVLGVAVVAGLTVICGGVGYGIQSVVNEGSTNASTPTVASPPTDPSAEITRETGSSTLDGFIKSVRERRLSIVKLYLKTGMSATTLSDHDTSALLYGFQDGENGDPVALLKVFQAGGFKLDDNLVDNVILLDPAYQAGLFQFNTPLAPKGFTLGYDPGQFVGPLMLWMVIKTTAGYATTQNLEQDFEVLKYLIAQGAECSIALSYLTYNNKYLTGTDPFTQVYPLIKNCKA